MMIAGNSRQRLKSSMLHVCVTCALTLVQSQTMGCGSSSSNGLTFRNGRYHKSVTLGKRRVKEGECCAVWSASGQHRLVYGPKRVWVWRSDVRFLDRYVVDERQYLEIKFRDGRKEHVRGPTALFLDPVTHESIAVRDVISLNAFEAIVVYTGDPVRPPQPLPEKQGTPGNASTFGPGSGIGFGEDVKAAVQRRIVWGPTLFAPMAHEWVHTFTWHSADPDDKGHITRGHTFQKLATLPDQVCCGPSACFKGRPVRGSMQEAYPIQHSLNCPRAF